MFFLVIQLLVLNIKHNPPKKKFSGTVATMFYLKEQILIQWNFFFCLFEWNILWFWHRYITFHLIFLHEHLLFTAFPRRRKCCKLTAKRWRFLVFRKKCFYFQIKSDVLSKGYVSMLTLSAMKDTVYLLLVL